MADPVPTAAPDIADECRRMAQHARGVGCAGMGATLDTAADEIERLAKRAERAEEDADRLARAVINLDQYRSCRGVVEQHAKAISSIKSTEMQDDIRRWADEMEAAVVDMVPKGRLAEVEALHARIQAECERAKSPPHAITAYQHELATKILALLAPAGLSAHDEVTS